MSLPVLWLSPLPTCLSGVGMSSAFPPRVGDAELRRDCGVSPSRAELRARVGDVLPWAAVVSHVNVLRLER